MTGDAPVTDGDPLIAALHEENLRLRVQNQLLVDQMIAMRMAQEELATHLRTTAPLRRVQESLRLRAGERRRRTPGELSPVDRSGSTHPSAAPSIDVTEEQASRHPLLSRTRNWMSGEPLLPEPDIRPLRTGRSGRVLVVVHVFYPELWPALAERIERIPVPVDLVVTLVEGGSEALADSIVAQFPDVEFEIVPNRGRDMWPFVRVVQLGLVGDYDAVLKLHTKSSVHRVDGDAWRDRLMDSLCPSAEGIGLILELLQRDPDVGMVAPEGAVLGREFWGANGPMTEALAARTGISVERDLVWFPGGSMFWSRPAPLNRLRDARLTIEDFEHEAVSIDGTAAHALERFVGVVVADAGMSVVGADEVAGRLAAARTRERSGGTDVR